MAMFVYSSAVVVVAKGSPRGASRRTSRCPGRIIFSIAFGNSRFLVLSINFARFGGGSLG
jgi:hypothetical protein